MMKTYVCRVCGYVYDEAQGDPQPRRNAYGDRGVVPLPPPVSGIQPPFIIDKFTDFR